MDEVIKKANSALLEGDREEVLRLLINKQPSIQVIWLRAQSVKEDDQRLALLRQISISGQTVYATLANNILERERQFDSDLSKPAEYKFWVRQPWQGRLKFLKKNKSWFIRGFVALLVLIIGIAIALSLIGQSQAATSLVSMTKTASAQLASQATPRSTPSVTPLPVSARDSVNYTAGKITLLRVELLTNRPVTFSNYGGDLTVATPAIGAQFAAFQIEFTCTQAICENPPEADITLRLFNNNIVRYKTGSRPILIEQPSMARVSNNQSIQGWFVFEIPSNLTPMALQVITGEDSPMLELEIPK